MSSMMMSHQEQQKDSLNGGISNIHNGHSYTNNKQQQQNLQLQQQQQQQQYDYQSPLRSNINGVNKNGVRSFSGTTPKVNSTNGTTTAAATTATGAAASSNGTATAATTNGSSSFLQSPSKSSQLSSSIPLSSSKSKKPMSYEAFAPRSQSQRSRLAKLQALTAGPIPTSSTSTTTSNAAASSSSDPTSSSNSFMEAMIPEQHTNPNPKQPQNQKESIDLDHLPAPEQEFIQSTLSQTNTTANHISSILHSASALSSTLNQTLSLTKSLSTKHSTLLQHSSELSYNAEKLQNEYDALIHHADDIGLPLKHYDDVDRLGVSVGILFKNGVVVRGIAKVKVDNGVEFQNVLDSLDEAIAFFERRSNAAAAANAASLEQMAAAEGEGSKTSLRSKRAIAAAAESSSGSMEYYKRSLVLHEAAIQLLKEAVVDRMNNTTNQIVNALNLKNVKNAVNGDVLEASLIYTRFHGISQRSSYLMNIIYKRMNVVYVPNPSGGGRKKKGSSGGTGSGSSSAPPNGSGNGSSTGSSKNDKRDDDMVCPYTELWTLCRNSYIANRTQLLRLSIRSHLDFLKAKHGLIGMTRLASVFLMRLCTVETSLYLDFFGKLDDDETEVDEEKKEDGIRAGDGEEATEKKVQFANGRASSSSSKSLSKSKNRDAATLASQVMSKDGTYYDHEFQAFLDDLCDNLHRTIRRGLVNVLDLDTLCQIVSVLREERSLANSSPTTMAAARSIGRVIVDAQERLIFCANSVLGKEVLRFKATPADLDYPDKLRKWKEQKMELAEKDAGEESREEEALKLQMQVYESWFPPIRSVLKVLSKIFRVVEPNVFEDIALTSIQSCSRSLKDGSMYIEKKSGVLHSDLFLVKNLLILREQLSPFDMQLRSVERQLDFSDAGKAVSRFIANRNRRLFSMTSENALITLLSEGVSTRVKSIDSKRDLEDSLRSACNDFIENTSISLAGPVLTFVEKCKGVSSANGGESSALSSQSFMNAEYVLTVMTRALDRLEPELGEINTQMSLYMESAATRSILLKPVVRKIARLLDEGRAFINEGAVIDDDGRWTKESKKEVLKVMDTFEKKVKSKSFT